MNSNKQGDFYCKFCGKHSTTKQGNSVHEKYCKLNPNRSEKLINNLGDSYKYATKGKKWIYKDDIGKMCYISEYESIYKNLGWKLGLPDITKQKIRKNTTGKCSTPEKEMERKRKISETMKKLHLKGVYNQEGGHGYRGFYKGIKCDSTWELAFLVYHIENDLNIKRCDKTFKYIHNNSEHIWTPDFITDEGIIEIKGYLNEWWKSKHSQYPEIILIDKIKIKPYLEYVINKYGDNFKDILYEVKCNEIVNKINF